MICRGNPQATRIPTPSGKISDFPTFHKPDDYATSGAAKAASRNTQPPTPDYSTSKWKQAEPAPRPRHRPALRYQPLLLGRSPSPKVALHLAGLGAPNFRNVSAVRSIFRCVRPYRRLSILNVLRTYEELLRNFSVSANAQLASVCVGEGDERGGDGAGKTIGCERPSHKEGLSGPDDACVRATSVSRYREQALNHHYQDRAPHEQHKIRDNPGHRLPDVGDPSDGVCRYDQCDRR